MWLEEGRHPDDLDTAYCLWTDGQIEHQGQVCEDLLEVCVSDYMTVDNEVCFYISTPTMTDFK